MIYLDNSATSRYKPLCVKTAVARELFNSANPGRGSHKASLRIALIVEECRELIQKTYFRGNVVFTKNCTEALNLGIFGVRPDKQVITTVYEHNSVLRPLKFLSDEGKIKLTVLEPNGKGNFEPALLKALKTPTSLVVVTAMSNVTGFAPDAETIADVVKKNSDAKILIDMAQAAGHLKFDCKNVDMCAFAGHKSLHGPQGTGFLLCKKNIRLRPLILGGTGTSTLSLRHPNDVPDGMEAGTINGLGIAGLLRGIEWTEKNFNKIRGKISELENRLRAGLERIKGVKIYACENGIVLCNFPGLSSETAADILSEKYGVCVRGGLHCAPLAHRFSGTLPGGAVRMSLGCDNTPGDVDGAVEAAREIAAENLKR